MLEIATALARLTGERPGESLLRNALATSIRKDIPGLERAARDGLAALERDDPHGLVDAVYEVGVLTGFLAEDAASRSHLKAMAARRGAQQRKAPAPHEFMRRWCAFHEELRQKLLADEALAKELGMAQGSVTNLRLSLEKDSTHPG